jgi:hypothetical protein
MTANSANNYLYLQNCTLRGGNLTLNKPNNANQMSAIVRDCAFDGTALVINDPNAANDFYNCSYNAYRSGANYLPGSSPSGNPKNDVFVTGGFNWQSGPLGNYYLPAGSPLIDANNQSGDPPASQVNVIVDGATGAQELLSSFTTQPTQTLDYGPVDIGYHYFSLLVKPAVLISGNSAGNFGVQTYAFTDGTLVNSFVPASASDGRGLAIYNGMFYYTEYDGSGDIYICSYGTRGSGPNPTVNSGILSNTWRPGVGAQALAFHNGALYVLTGYPLLGNPANNSLKVFELNPTTGAVIGPANGITINPPVQDPLDPYATGISDGFTVLPNGDFLINDYDGSDGNPIYREYNGSTGALVQGLGAAQIDVSLFGLAYGTGVTVSPDGNSLFLVAGIGFGQTLVQTDLKGNLMGTQSIDNYLIEGIGVVQP